MLASTQEKRPFEIILKPDTEGIDLPSDELHPELIDSCEYGDCKTWTVTLGKPLLNLDAKMLIDEGQCRIAKHKLKSYIELDNINRAYRLMGISWANWIYEMDWDKKPFQKAWALEGDVPVSDPNQFYRTVGPYLVALIKRMKSEGNKKAEAAAKELFYSLEDKFQ